MKKFLLKLATFLVILLAGYTAFLTTVIGLNRRALPSCRLEKPVDSIIVGDSHTMWSIDDSNIEGLRNVSLNAEGYRYTYEKLAHLLRTEPGIKKVYIGFGYHNLAGYYDAYIFGPTVKHFIHRYLSILTGGDALAIARHRPIDFFSIATEAIKKGWRPGLKGECQLYGTFPVEKKMEQFSLSSMKKRIVAQYFEGQKVSRNSDSNVENLKKLVDLSRQYGLEVTMLNTPLHAEYREHVPAEYKERYARFLRDNQVHVFDFSDMPLSDADFLPDGDHTNYAGAMLTTARFREFHENH